MEELLDADVLGRGKRHQEPYLNADDGQIKIENKDKGQNSDFAVKQAMNWQERKKNGELIKRISDNFKKSKMSWKKVNIRNDREQLCHKQH